MKVVVCFKSVYDDASIRVNPADKTLDYTAVPHVVSLYDLNAIEVAAQFAESSKEHTLVALTAGDTTIHNTTMRKDVAARGASEVYLVMDDALYEAETYQTATALAAAIEKIGDVDLIICGDGSADVYAHQVGIQLGEIMGIPNINGVCEFEAEGNVIHAKRELDEIVESVTMQTPCVLSCLSDMAQPRVCNVMQIMTAGKKPVYEWSLADLGIEDPGKDYELGTTILPAPSPRKLEFYEGNAEGIEQFVKKLHNYLMTEGA